VPAELFEFWEERDPIRRLECHMVKEGLITPAEVDQMQQRINAEIDVAIAQAEQDPYPDPEDCLRDVYEEQQ
jgi:TPP-dependent pyruvate/acetoin dehydrogenase alpha subunit